MAKCLQALPWSWTMSLYQETPQFFLVGFYPFFPDENAIKKTIWEEMMPLEGVELWRQRWFKKELMVEISREEQVLGRWFHQPRFF